MSATRFVTPALNEGRAKLGSNTMGPGKETIRTFVLNFLGKELDNFLHRHPDIAEAIEEKIKESEKTRKENLVQVVGGFIFLQAI